MEAAVNCLVIEPNRNFVDGELGICHSRFALVENGLASPGHKHRPHEMVGRDKGLDHLFHAKNIRRGLRCCRDAFRIRLI